MDFRLYCTALYSTPWHHPGTMSETQSPPRLRGEATESDAPPSRPAPFMEWLGRHLLYGLAPRLRPVPRAEVPAALGEHEVVRVPRSDDPGTLDARLFPATGNRPASGDRARGVVVLGAPWLRWGQQYFFRRGRIQALRDAGYHAFTFDFGGFGSSGPRSRGFADRDLDDVLDFVRHRFPGLPLHLWGVSAGAYWGHVCLSRRDDVRGAFFEHVAENLIHWSRRTLPAGLPFYLFYRHVLRSPYRYIHVGRHAPYLGVRAAAYVGAENDRGVPADVTRRLAELAGAEVRIYPDADHLDAIRVDGEGLIRFALHTFARAETAPGTTPETAPETTPETTEPS